MLPLAAKEFPATPDELVSALIGGLAARGIAAKSVQAEGGALSALAALRVDLTGAQFTRDFRVTSSSGTATTIAAEHFEIAGAPVDFEGTPLEVRVDATHTTARLAGSPTDGALVLADAAEGFVALAVTQAALEALLLRLARAAAEKQGVEIKRTKLTLTARGPRALGFVCEITAKMFVMSADVSLSGNLDVDDQLDARLTSLTLGGDAMITKLAASFVRPYLDKLEGRVIPLAAFTPGELKLRDVEITATGGLQMRAKFGRD